jgi:hypothetical protein
MHRLINFPTVRNGSSGALTFIEGDHHIPFDIKRVYYIYDTLEFEKRGRHAYKTIQSLILALNGHFDLTLDDGYNRSTITLSRPDLGVYVPSMTWKELDNMSSGAVCLVLVSDNYKENDYIRDYATFIREARVLKQK